MRSLLDYPLLVFALSLSALWLSAHIGAFLRKKRLPIDEGERQDFMVVLASTLTLLGLIIGFSFSMVISRYDQRRLYEEDEANAIGTEYIRADVLPPSDALAVRELLRSYLDQRMLFYEVQDVGQLKRIDAETAKLQNRLWTVVQSSAAKQPTPVMALVVSGMNDVLNSQGYTQFAWRNRYPAPAWSLLAFMAILCNVLFGYGARRASVTLFIILPLAISGALFLLADISSPRHGLIHVTPMDLLSLSQSLRTQ